jgi:hypothetical protein
LENDRLLRISTQSTGIVFLPFREDRRIDRFHLSFSSAETFKFQFSFKSLFLAHQSVAILEIFENPDLDCPDRRPTGKVGTHFRECPSLTTAATKLADSFVTDLLLYSSLAKTWPRVPKS